MGELAGLDSRVEPLVVESVVDRRSNLTQPFVGIKMGFWAFSGL